MNGTEITLQGVGVGWMLPLLSTLLVHTARSRDPGRVTVMVMVMVNQPDTATEEPSTG